MLDSDTHSSPKDPVGRLVFELSKLPGIGEKSATRLAYHILKQERVYADSLARALTDAKTKIRLCEVCMTFTDQSPCRICEDPSRSKSTICVVEKPSDIHPIERAGGASLIGGGTYHVLHGVLSPLDGVGPEDLKIRELLERVQKEEVTEIILATNPSVEGDATALYLTKLLKPAGVKVTQLAHGLPVGAVLEYTDQHTLGKALENRVEVGA